MSELSIFESAKQDYEKEIYDLKQEIEYLRSTGSLGILDRKCKELQNINEKLSLALESAEQRIDKATNYINENWGHWCSNHCKYATETINILQGKE